VAPTSEVEKRLVNIWQNFIGIEPIGIHDNFFELGGHSLMATQIISRLQDAYHISLPLRTFFEASTIAELGKRIEAFLWIEQNNEVPTSSSVDREELTL
jgi:acyl carrier protein